MSSVVSDYAPDLPREHADFAVRFADGYVKLAALGVRLTGTGARPQALEMLQQTGNMTRLLDRLSLVT